MNAPLLTGINLGVLWRLMIIRIILTGNGEIARKHATKVKSSSYCWIEKLGLLLEKNIGSFFLTIQSPK